jgi:hypothetical protein
MGRVGAHSLRSHISFLSAAARRDGAMPHSGIGVTLSLSPPCLLFARLRARGPGGSTIGLRPRLVNRRGYCSARVNFIGQYPTTFSSSSTTAR